LPKYVPIVNCKLGDFTYCSYDCKFNNAIIGKFCSIGPNVIIAPGKHPTSEYVSTHPSIFSTQPIFSRTFVSKNIYKEYEVVKIGNDVWIGANCVIVDGVTIGDGAIVAANSVVNKDLGDYEIVGGVPARLIRKRFNDKEIEYLLKLKWWNKSEEWIQNNIAQFWSVDGFINYEEQSEE
jgi:acetyltransferase-like isoleucine patch superfamily enzyme